MTGSPPGISATHTYNNAGTFTVRFTGFDATGGESEAHEDVTVNSPPPPNQAPTCTFSVTPSSGPAPLNVLANANCQDPDNNITTVSISWGDGSPPATGNSPNLADTHTYSSAGTFTVTATATDSGGLTGSASQSVSVTSGPPANAPPTCALSVVPDQGQAPLTVTATGGCTDPENRLASTTLDWGDGTSTPASSGTHTYSSPGNFQVVLTGRDLEGASGSASQRVNVGGGPPPPPGGQAPTCTLNVSPTGGEAPVTVTAAASCTDPDNDISTTVIAFGDGFYQSGTNATHIFPNGGSFTVSVTATDRAGNTSNTPSRSVTVSETPKLFAGVRDGQVKEFSRSGSTLRTLNTNQGGSITGMAIDSVDSLYVTNFTANTVTRFSGNGSLIGNFGSSYNCKPESIVFDESGNAYVGQSDCNKAILKFDAYGNLFTGISVQTESTGSDAIDLAGDQCTIFYTSEGASVLRYNACTNQQLSPFATGLDRALALRILGDGGAVVANNTNIVRFDSNGRQIQTYDANGQDCWAALTLDRNPGSFWAADFCTSDIVRFDIGSGNQITKFNSGTARDTVFGLGMKRAAQQTGAAGPLVASPTSASIAAGESASFSLAFSPNKAAENEQFTFACANLPVGATCTFSPATFTADKNGNSATLTINTALRTGSLRAVRSEFVYALMLPLVALTVGGLSMGRRSPTRRLRLLLVAVLLLVSAFGFSLLGGCGGGADSQDPTQVPGRVGTTPPGNYTVIISANSGSLASSTSVSLTVR
ncbi:MAG: PKD domain-containing protein [Acidobacteriales bacterium]|nr:PKD domain-containing protein [Terriglobales bacterium]